MREHRYKFYISTETEFERDALAFIEKHELDNPHRSSELVRRILSQGYSFYTMLDTMNISIGVIDEALQLEALNKRGKMMLLRLNPGDINSGLRVWQRMLQETKIKARKTLLRKLFLYGYWLEKTHESSPEAITAVLGAEIHKQPAEAPKEPIKPQAVIKTEKAKQSLGNLMP